jgi:hypothetical protein
VVALEARQAGGGRAELEMGWLLCARRTLFHSPENELERPEYREQTKEG